jgi:hypothetical protein
MSNCGPSLALPQKKGKIIEFGEKDDDYKLFSSVAFTMRAENILFCSVFRIRIHRINVFLGLPDPDPDPLVRGMDPDPALDPDPSIIMKNNKKNLESYYFVTLIDFYL